jgi:hypothetical protein
MKRTFLLLGLSAGLGFGQLQGIVDVHVHSDPDAVPRKLDGLDTARQAKDAGMRAIVLKNHWEPTVQMAYIVGKVVPGIEVFGAISLDRAVGGVNPEAVQKAAAFAGKKLKIVWMPTFDSENNVRFAKSNTPFAPVAKNGQLLPETVEVIKIIAKEKVVLATGHSSAAEDLLLVREGRKQGVGQIVVTHPLFAAIRMTIPQMKELAGMGAFIELCGNAVLPTQPKAGQLKVEDYVATIRQVGAEHVILSGDFGSAANPPHAEAWKQLLAILKKAGVTDGEIDTIARKNPATLLGL